jgi:hypothetical protein
MWRHPRETSIGLLVSQRSGALGVTGKYRLQFLRGPTAQGTAVLLERTVAGGVDAAIKHAAEVEWPPGAAALRLVDLDGQEVYERTKIDRS